MRFRSATANRTYTVLAFDQERDTYGRVTKRVPGIRAEFRGLDHVFDSEAQAKEKGWDEDTRLEVERYLLGHKHFGRIRVMDLGGPSPEEQRGNASFPELYFAPGQTLPDEHLEFCKTQRWWQIEEDQGQHADAAKALAQAAAVESLTESKPCIYRALNESNEVVECSNDAEPGHDYCTEHLAVVAASMPA